MKRITEIFNLLDEEKKGCKKRIIIF